MSSFTIPAFFGKLGMGTSPLPLRHERLRKAWKKKGRSKKRKEKKNKKKQKTKIQKQKNNKEKEKEGKENTCFNRIRTHELCYTLQCIACMHTLFLNIRMLVLRARLNVLIFLPILVCNILVLFLNYNWKRKNLSYPFAVCSFFLLLLIYYSCIIR